MQRKPGRASSGHSYGHTNHHHHAGSSSHYSRLRPVELDPLSEYGLPSKGEKRLLSPKVQESYYSKIAERYLAFCTEAGDKDNLQKQFARLSVADPNNNNNNNNFSVTTNSPIISVPPSPLTSGPPTPLPLPTPNSITPSSSFPDISFLSSPPDKETTSSSSLPSILSALRKLREALVATRRLDPFTVQVYLFAIRLGILAKSYESYYPALLYLLRTIHPSSPLTSVELSECVSYLVLDTACRRQDLAAAFKLRREWKLHDKKVDGVLRALVGDNYVLWGRVKKGVDGYRVKLMEFADGDVKKRALVAMGRAYLSLPREFLEGLMEEGWEGLRARYGVGWELGGEKGERVVIRKVGRG
ncbi:hypothetical protein QBC40DRAFT_266797 [Triangularia verruculosa]|uniref:CSN8/PSMD8/EIF3K domain-containing protein n=1 Tax=Triangularia verruculosa TaxID=2587418 RepID=A0AAN7ATU3_9PEZI|nr:hypothetical protein QBC40DRAFT_266797 [Triangularia verruculosa]